MEPVENTDPIVIGPYRVLGVLGTGGMGRVYLGVDEAGGRAAVKVVNAELLRESEFRRRFVREASATAAVTGRFIAGVVASDLEARQPWLATEFIDGPSLYEIVAVEGPLAPSRAQAVASGLAEALSTIHAAGVIHRDVKPSNVLLAADGPYLIDFGIAREAAASTITRTGTVVGTPPYMAPEQIRGRRPVGPPADVFALGGVLTFALTGRHPFGEGDSTTLAYRIAHEEPDLDGIKDEVVRALILSCLGKEPAERPTALELWERLASEATRVVPVAGGAAGIKAVGAADAALVPARQLVTQLAGPAGPADLAESGNVVAASKDSAEPVSAGDVSGGGARANATTDDADDASDQSPAPGPSRRNRRRRVSVAALVALGIVVLGAGILSEELGQGGSHPSALGRQSPGGPATSASTTTSASTLASTGGLKPINGALTSTGSTGPNPLTVSGQTTTTPAGGITGSTPNGAGNPTITASPITTTSFTSPGSVHTTTTPPHPTTTTPPVTRPTTSSPPPPQQGNPPQPVSNASSSLSNSSNYGAFELTITWSPQSDATSFDIHYTWSGVGSPSIDKIYHVSGTSYTIDDIPYSSEHYCWSIRAVNRFGTSGWDAGSPHC